MVQWLGLCGLGLNGGSCGCRSSDDEMNVMVMSGARSDDEMNMMVMGGARSDDEMNVMVMNGANMMFCVNGTR